jgi:hypothetical protein
VLARFFKHVEKDLDSDCLIWQGSTKHTGYGEFSYYGDTVIAHRFIYIALKNNYEWLDRDVVIKHSCDRKSCVNVEHLSAGTQKENVQEAFDRGLRIRNSEKVYCNNGHKRSESDYICSTGYARCRECDREYQRRVSAKKKNGGNNV